MPFFSLVNEDCADILKKHLSLYIHRCPLKDKNLSQKNSDPSGE